MKTPFQYLPPLRDSQRKNLKGFGWIFASRNGSRDRSLVMSVAMARSTVRSCRFGGSLDTGATAARQLARWIVHGSAETVNNFTSIRGRLRLLKIYLPAGLVLLMNIHQTFLPHHPTLPPRTLAHTPHLLPRSLATLLSDTLAKSTLPLAKVLAWSRLCGNLFGVTSCCSTPACTCP
jgi:hypothetical protein